MPDFHVGPYGLFIWPAYAVSAAGLVWMVVDSLIRSRRWRLRAERRQPRGEP